MLSPSNARRKVRRRLGVRHAHPRIARPFEYSVERVIVLVGDGIEHVIVTAGAAQSQAHDAAAERIKGVPR